LRDVLGGKADVGMAQHRPLGVSPALKALQHEARLLLTSYEEAIAAYEEATARLREARLVADENGLFKPRPGSQHYNAFTGRDTLRDVQYWKNELLEREAVKVNVPPNSIRNSESIT